MCMYEICILFFTFQSMTWCIGFKHCMHCDLAKYYVIFWMNVKYMEYAISGIWMYIATYVFSLAFAAVGCKWF